MKIKIQHLLIALTLLASLTRVTAKFTDDANQTKVQGVLSTAAGPAPSGNYDFTFTLFDNSTNGNVLGGPITNIATAVDSNGLFITTMDFGSSPWTGTTTNFLEIAVQTNGGNGFTTLSPRLLMNSTPLSIFAFSAGTASNAASSSNFSGAITGDVSGTQGATVVSSVGGQTAVSIANGVIAANGATSSDTPGAIVARDVNGSFSAGSVTLSGGLYLPFPAMIYSDGDAVFVDEGSLYIGNPIGSGGSGNVGLGDSTFASGNNVGDYNTAVGEYALFANTSGQFNTANGYAALYKNTTGSQNTANGARSLLLNTTGSDNTVNGYDAFVYNTTGIGNTANGVYALTANTSGSLNTANGMNALYGNTTGSNNTADGAQALYFNNADGNTANGYQALYANTSGSGNTADGQGALFTNTTGTQNTANGVQALYNSTGISDIGIGYFAGYNLMTGNNDIYIGNQGTGCNFSPAENNTIRIGANDNTICTNINTTANTYIAGIYDNGSLDYGTQVPVYVDYCGHLGVMCSSERYKQNIRNMDDASDALLSLRPVTYQYKPGLDPKGKSQFGLVAEEVDKVDPDLVVHDARHGIYTVRYEAINAMLLNEFLKQHRKVEEQSEKIQDQDAEIETLKGKSAKLDSLEIQNDSLVARLNELEAAVKALAERK